MQISTAHVMNHIKCHKISAFENLWNEWLLWKDLFVITTVKIKNIYRTKHIKKVLKTNLQIEWNQHPLRCWNWLINIRFGGLIRGVTGIGQDYHSPALSETQPDAALEHCMPRLFRRTEEKWSAWFLWSSGELGHVDWNWAQAGERNREGSIRGEICFPFIHASLGWSQNFLPYIFSGFYRMYFSFFDIYI